MYFYLHGEERRDTVFMRINLVKCGMITRHNELCCTYAQLAVRCLRWLGALHRLPAHGTRSRLRGGAAALDAGHAASLTTALSPLSDKAMMILSIIIADVS